MTAPAAQSVAPAATDEDQQPWQWPEARWRGVVEHVRAGRPLRPRG